MSNQSNRPAAPAKASDPAPAQGAAPAEALPPADAAEHAAIAARAADRSEHHAKLSGDAAVAAQRCVAASEQHVADAQSASQSAGTFSDKAADSQQGAERALAVCGDHAGHAARSCDEATAAAARAESASNAADLAARKAQETALQVGAAQDGDAGPLPRIVCTSARKYASEFPPRPSDDGTAVVLCYSPRRDDPAGQDVPEATVGLDGYRDLRTGVFVKIPDGYVGEVTTAGRKNERIVAALLYGAGDEELVVRVWNRGGGFMTIRAGEELARVSLRRLPPVEFSYDDPWAALPKK